MLKNFKVQENTTAPAFQVITGDISDWMEKEAAKSKIEFEKVFDEWAKARGNEAQTLRFLANNICKKEVRVVQKEYYGHNAAMEIFKPETLEFDNMIVHGLVAIIKVTWNKKELWMGIMEGMLNKEQTHDYTGKYYDVTQNEHIGLALQINLSFNNAWFQFWRTNWFSEKIPNVDVPKVYRILD